MATHVFNNMRLWRGSTDLAGKTNQLKLGLTTELLPDTGLDNTGWRAFLPGLNLINLDHQGRLDLGAGSVEAALWAEHGLADQPITLSAAAAVGSRAYLLRGVPSDLEIGGEVGELHSFTVMAKGSGKFARGVLLEPGATARTATFNGTATQHIAVPAGQSLYAALHVLAASGTVPTLDVVVQSDDAVGMASPTSRITFTQATATGYQWSSSAGPITDDWFRVAVTIGGTAPSFLFVVSIGIAR